MINYIIIIHQRLKLFYPPVNRKEPQGEGVGER